MGFVSMLCCAYPTLPSNVDALAPIPLCQRSIKIKLILHNADHFCGAGRESCTRELSCTPIITFHDRGNAFQADARPGCYVYEVEVYVVPRGAGDAALIPRALILELVDHLWMLGPVILVIFDISLIRVKNQPDIPKPSAYTYATTRPRPYGHFRCIARLLPKYTPPTPNVTRSREFPHGKDAKNRHSTFTCDFILISRPRHPTS